MVDKNFKMGSSGFDDSEGEDIDIFKPKIDNKGTAEPRIKQEINPVKIEVSRSGNMFSSNPTNEK